MSPAHKNPSGWADYRCMLAYDMLHKVDEMHKSLGLHPEFAKLLKQIEAIDELIAEARKDAA